MICIIACSIQKEEYNLKFNKNKNIIPLPYKMDIYKLKSRFHLKHLILLCIFTAFLVAAATIYAYIRTNVSDSAEPAFKPQEAMPEASNVPEPDAEPVLYEATPTTILITENIFYDQGRLIITKDLLEDINTHEEDYDNELRYVFPIHFKEPMSTSVPIEENAVNTIELYPDSVVINTLRIMAFNVTSDDHFLYIDCTAPKEKYDKIVFLDPGHGDVDDGATVDGISEKDMNLALAMKVYRLFQDDPENDIKIYMTRQDDRWLTPADRVELVGDIGDFIVSIHHNVYEHGPEPYGTETYYQDREQATGSSGLTSSALAAVLHKNIVAQIKSRDRGVMYNDKYYILNHAAIPTALAEIGFMTNPEEMTKLLDDEYAELAAVGIYNGIKEICNQWSFR